MLEKSVEIGTDKKTGKSKLWIDITNPTPDELEKVAKKYHLKKSVVRDCLDPEHLPKQEKLNHCTFIIARLFNGNAKAHLDSIHDLTTKIAIFYNEDFLITVHRLEQQFMDEIQKSDSDENPGNATINLVSRIILYVLQTFEQPAIMLSEQVDTYEATILLKNTRPALLHGMYYIKRKASTVKKILLLSDDLITFLKNNYGGEEVTTDVLDLYTKLLTLYDQVLEDVNNLLNIYLSLTAQKTNEVMKVLTIFSVFFLPLTFLAGVYGMNFDYMPELHFPWAYPAVLILMAVFTFAIFLYFKRKRWL